MHLRSLIRGVYTIWRNVVDWYREQNILSSDQVV